MVRNLHRILLTACTTAVVLLTAAPAAGADTNPDGTLAVDVLEGRVRLTAGGDVVVPLRARCARHLDAFELDVAVVQTDPARSGATNTIGGAFPVCDGRWHRTAVTVSADVGRYRPGWARIGVYLGAYDSVQGTDTDATDQVGTRLRRPASA